MAALSPQAWGWFERAVFDLSIAKAHLQSRLWLEGAQLARQAAVKFLQAALVQTGEPEPAPQISRLSGTLRERLPAFGPKDHWTSLDRFAGAEEASQAEAEQAYAFAEEIRDAVSEALERP